MAIKKIKVSQLPIAETTEGLSVLGVDSKNQSVQAEMELLRGNKGESAFELWLMEPGNEDKSYEDYLAYNRQPATDAANELNAYQKKVTYELNQLAEDTEQVRVAAEQASQRANIVASNPTKIGDDNYVYIYNEETKTYDKTDIWVKGDSAYQLWIKEEVNVGKTYEEYLAYNRQPATNAAEELNAYQTQVTAELTQLSEDTTEVKNATQQAIDRAHEIANNPTKVGEDNFVYKYNEETKTYDKTEIWVKGDSAYQLWLKETGNEDKNYEDYLAYNRKPATDAATALGEYQTQVTSELTQLATDTEVVKHAAWQATDRANEVAGHPTLIGEDHFVYRYNETTKIYDKTDIYVKGDKGDKGNLLYASFEVDMDSGQLVMVVPEDYDGPSFEMNENGELLAILNA